MSLIPTELPFNLGSAVELPTMMPYGITSLLPMNTLPFTLSAKQEPEEVPYGSVGWEIICRSHKDFKTEIFKTSDMAPPTFSKELSSTGLASVSFDLDSYLFTKTLTNGRPVEDLFDYENLWEIYFDKKLRFQFLGTASKETPVDSSEVRSATVSGNGIGQVLAWASVYPPNFPNIIRKVETLKDNFDGDKINTTLWNKTSTLKGGIDLVRDGQKAELLQIIDQLTSDKESKTSELASNNAALTSAKNDYNAVFKDKTSTPSQRTNASADLLKATSAQKKSVAELAVINIKLTDAQLKSTLAPNLVEGDNSTRVRLAITTTGDKKTLGAGTFTFQSSGISARIEPLPQGSLGGQARTTFGIVAGETSWAYFYTASIGGNRRIVAEVNDVSNSHSADFAYDPNINSYWRIREDHGTVIFETAPNTASDTWTEMYRVNDVSWVSDSVSVIFEAELNGNSGTGAPMYAYMADVNGSNIPAVDSLMAVYKEYLVEAQKRGTIPYVVADFTDTEDSAGASWVGLPDIDVEEGTNLLQLIQSFSQLQQFDWIMDNDFRLKVFQKVWNEDEGDPTLGFHKEDKIVLHEANAQLLRERSRDRSSVGNTIVGKSASSEYAYMEDSDSIDKYQRRELFIQAGNAADLATLGTVLEASLSQVSEAKDSWRLQVDPDLPGKRVFEDYDVGDWIGVETIDSRGVATKNTWRVVGIGIQVDNDGNTLAELTLQSRMELLAERLQNQISNLTTTANTAGITTGSNISVATLIEQATLSGLLDVSLPPTDSRVAGDVLTWTGNYFTLETPGDKTIPAAPTITSVASNVYYPEIGTSTKAQIQIEWTTPLNEDGSTITDGHHFELRFRPDTTLPYTATWEEAEQHLWSEMFAWNQPTIPAIIDIGWQTLFVPFEDNSTFIQELSPGVKYELQIRAVDGSTPQHFGEWSESVLHEAAEDSIPPAQPAPPVVAASMVAIQVTHYLGQASGGQFNLPPDMSHLEVHVGGPAFYPSDDTYVGKIVADVSILRGRTPVIQTFPVDSTENVWVRVIAVDRTGNKSTPSTATTSQVNLIDDAHISDLTASKITAGTISSSIILSGVIKTAEDGPRAEMNFEGFRIFGEDDDASVALLGTPGANGNFLMIKDPEDLSATLAGIDGTGRGSFQSVSVTDDITIQGEQLIEDIINPRSKGVIALGIYEGDPVVGAGTGIERGFLEISFEAEESRSYMICGVTEFDSTSSANERLLMRLFDFGESDPVVPVVGGTRLSQSLSPLVGVAGVNSAAQVMYTGTFTPGTHRILWTFAGQLGNATVSALVATGTNCKSIFWVEDIGLPATDTIILNDGGTPAFGSATTPDKTTTSPKATYTKTYACTWSGTYRSNGDYSSSHGNGMVQGDSGSDSYLNDARALAGFNYTQIMNDLKGATIKSCYVTMYANHWWYNDGGTARIGTHNYTGRPSKISSSRYTAQRISSASWPKPGKRKVSLGTSIGNDFKSGAAKGILLGPTDGSRRQYGKFNGNGQSNEPVLTITYVK